MSIFLWMLAAFGVGYIVGFISRELQTLLYYTAASMKARRELAKDQAYDKAVEEANKQEKGGLPDPDAVSDDTPEMEPEDIQEEEKRKGTKTFYS